MLQNYFINDKESKVSDFLLTSPKCVLLSIFQLSHSFYLTCPSFSQLSPVPSLFRGCLTFCP